MRADASWFGADLDRVGVALVAHRVVAEHRFEQLGRGQRPGGARRRRALHRGAALFELELVDRRLQAVGLLVHRVGELLGRLGIALLRQLLLHLGLDLGTHRIEALLLAAALAGELDDVVAEVGSRRRC